MSQSSCPFRSTAMMTPVQRWLGSAMTIGSFRRKWPLSERGLRSQHLPSAAAPILPTLRFPCSRLRSLAAAGETGGGARGCVRGGVERELAKARLRGRKARKKRRKSRGSQKTACAWRYRGRWNQRDRGSVSRPDSPAAPHRCCATPGCSCSSTRSRSAGRKEPVENPHAELQSVDGHALVDPVEQGPEIEVGREQER